MSQPLLKVTDLAKSFSGVWALSSAQLTVGSGEIHALLGENGAGKSTTVKALSGILVPDGGTCTVMGRVPWRERIAHVARIGVVFGQRTQLWWDLPLADSLELLQHMYRVPADRFAKNLTTARELLDLDPFMQTPVRQLSLGQRMRGDLAAALLHSPPILYLDEPTIGLDIVAKTRIREFLAELNREEGVTILDGQHVLRLANPSFVRLFDLKSDPVGQTILRTLRESAFEEMVRTALATGAGALLVVARPWGPSLVAARPWGPSLAVARPWGPSLAVARPWGPSLAAAAPVAAAGRAAARAGSGLRAAGGVTFGPSSWLVRLDGRPG